MHIEHVALYVRDLVFVKDFFIQYLGAAAGEKYINKTTGFQSYFLSFDHGARLELMWKPHMEDAEKTLIRTGFIHLAFRLGSKDAVDALTEKLKADGYPVLSVPRTTGDGYYESCILGPESNQIELTV